MFTTSVSDDAVNIVNETLKSTFISSGKKADKFEDRLKIFDLILAQIKKVNFWFKNF